MFLYTKRTTFAHGFSITEIQRWFMSQQQMFNRTVRKYNCRTTKQKLYDKTRYNRTIVREACLHDVGREFVLLLQNAEKGTAKVPAEVVPERHYEHGIAGIAKIFGCSIPTANRIKKSGVIAPAITQVARKIVVDVELALELAKKAGDFTSIRK